MEKYIPIGFTKKCHGVKGEIKVQVDKKYLEDFVNASSLFLLIKGKHVPHFVENIRDGKDVILKLEEINSKESATKLTSKEIFLLPKQIIKATEKEIEQEDNLAFGKYIGFKIHDESQGGIGIIKEVIEFPQQEMAVIFQNEKEILIPLHEDLIEKIEEEKQCIYMNLPEGLLDL